MAGLLNQVGAAPFGANNDAAAAEQQTLQGDASPSLNNASQSSDLGGSGSQMQNDLLQEAFIAGPVQPQGPTPVKTLAEEFDNDAADTTGTAGAGAAAVAKGAARSRKANGKAKKKGTKPRPRPRLTRPKNYSEKRRQARLAKKKGGAMRPPAVQPPAGGKGKGGRPKHSCGRCKKKQVFCSLKDAAEGSYAPCDCCARGGHKCMDAVPRKDEVTGGTFYRVRDGATYHDEFENEAGRVYKRRYPATATEPVRWEQLDEEEKVVAGWHDIIDEEPEAPQVEQAQAAAPVAAPVAEKVDEVSTWLA